MTGVNMLSEPLGSWKASSIMWENLPWARSSWLPELRHAFPALDAVRPEFEAAARALTTAQARQRAAIETQAASASAALAAARGEPAAAAAPARSALQLAAEMQAAREEEARAVIALCDQVDRIIHRVALDNATVADFEQRVDAARCAPHRDGDQLHDRQALAQFAQFMRQPEGVGFEIDGARKAARSYLSNNDRGLSPQEALA